MQSEASLEATTSTPTLSAIPHEAVVLPNGRPLPPLPEFDLPSLPPITDKDLRENTSTHTSVYGIRRDGREFNLNNKVLDYEKLEHVGDALLGSCVVVLLHELYPNLRQGPASRLKDDLVSNDMLAQLADRYGISDQLKASNSAYYVTKLQVKTRGSLFESYIAGVYYSFLKHGSPSTSGEDSPDLIGPTPEGSSSPEKKPHDPNPSANQDKRQSSTSNTRPKSANVDPESVKAQADRFSSPSDGEDSESDSDKQRSSEDSAMRQYPTMVPSQPNVPPPSRKITGDLASVVKQTETLSITCAAAEGSKTPKSKAVAKPPTDGEAFDYIYAWLGPLFSPIARYALQYRLDEQTRLNTAAALENQDDEDHMAGGAKCALDQYAKNKWDVDPVYGAVRPEGVKGAWICTCTIMLPDGTVWKGEAVRRTKKLGSSVAAYKVAKQLQVL